MIKGHFIEKVQLQLEFKEEQRIYRGDFRNNKKDLQKHKSRKVFVQRTGSLESFNVATWKVTRNEMWQISEEPDNWALSFEQGGRRKYHNLIIRGERERNQGFKLNLEAEYSTAQKMNRLDVTREKGAIVLRIKQ